MFRLSDTWRGPRSRLERLSTLFRRAAPAVSSGARSFQDIDTLARRIHLPSLPVTDEEMARAACHDRGQRLVRQGAWRALSEAIREADAARQTTPGGEPEALLMACGARSDVVAVAEDALRHGRDPDPEGLARMTEEARARPQDHAPALVVALAHMDIAERWLRLMGRRAPHMAEARATYHLVLATELLLPFEAQAGTCPALAAGFARQAAITERPAARLSDRYEHLITLDPQPQAHMRAYGRALLDAPDGGSAALEVAARRMALRTETEWGCAGYVWVYLDALALDPAPRDLIDAGFFIQGMRDILDRRDEPHVVNQLAAFCAITLAPSRDIQLTPHAQAASARIHGFLDHILRHHLSELHPLIWAQALLTSGQIDQLPPRRALVAKGNQVALRIIAARLADDIVAAGAVAFSRTGLQLRPAFGDVPSIR
ncbi:MAG: hypothetical protein AAF484_12665 [Pseudomonadota bacterium]